MQDEKNLAWLDLEMTGLEPEKDLIMEIATIVTDSELRVLAEGPVMAIHQPKLILDHMDPWCVDQHGKSGLTKKCLESTITVEEAQARTGEFIAKYCPERKAPLCGTTIVE